MSDIGLKHLTYGKFLRYVMPSIITMVFMATYTIMDGAFISVLVGPTALAGTNIVYPIVNVMLGIGIMFATGAAAIVAMTLGEKKEKEANEKFTLSIIASLIVGIVIMVLILLFFDPILKFLGVNEAVYPYSYAYGIIAAVSYPIGIAKEMFVTFLRVDGKAKLSMYITILGGIINIVLDYIFIRFCGLGVAGAAIATTLGMLTACLIGLSHFLSSRSKLKFCRFRVSFSFLLFTMGNGSSEMVNQISTGITTYMFNIIAMRYMGENGVAAITIILYAQFLFIALYLGLSMGAGPLISYNYGAKDGASNGKIMKYSGLTILVSGVFIAIMSFAGAGFVVGLFANPDTEVYLLAEHGLRIFSSSFLFCGFNIYTSGMFTAYGNGMASASIAALRSLILLVAALLILPYFFQFEGLWAAIPLVEFLTLFLTVWLLIRYRKQYFVINN